MGLLQLLVLGTTILPTLTSAQLLQDVRDPLYSSTYNFSPEQIEDQKGNNGFYDEYDDYDLDSSELTDLLRTEEDSNDYEQELDNLIDSINSAEEDVEEEEEDHFLNLLNILEDLEESEEVVNFEVAVDPEDECDNTQCNNEIVQSPDLDEEIENGKRQKRSPSPGIRSSSSRSSSSRSSSSRSSSSRSSSGSSGSSSSRSRGGWFSRRSSSSSRSSSSRGSSSRGSSSRGSSSRGSSSRSSSSRGSSSRGSSSSSSGSRGSTSSTSTSGSSSTSSSGSTSVIKPIGPSTGTAAVAGAGTGAAIGAASGSSSTGSKPVQPSGGYPTGTQPAAGYPTGTQPAGGYPTGTKPASGYPTGTQPAAGYPTGSQPAAGYPTGTQPAGGYPTGTQPAAGYPTGTQPAAGYPTGTQPAGGYPTGTKPAAGYPTGTQPAAGYPTGTQPASGYPTGTQPAGGYPTGTQPASGYPTGTQPAGGYPSGTNPSGGYPTGTQPVGGYPTGTQPVGGYPSGTRPSGGYPTGTQPAGGYPTGTQPAGGYPSGTRPSGGYPTGTQPAGGYPTGTQPVGGYPTGTRPVSGYPTGTQPAAGYPGYPSGTRPFGSSNQPFGGYPTGNQPYGGGYPGNQPYGGGYSGYRPYAGYPASTGGFPMSSHGGYSSGGFSRGFASGGLAAGGLAAGGLAGAGLARGGFAGAGGYPAGGYPMPERKKSKKNKIKGLLAAAGTAYAVRKAHKAHKKNKFLSPFGHSSGGYGRSHHGFGGGGFSGGKLAGAGLGLAAGKTAKKILGAYVKIQIAKYALKFGAKAAKAYFEYKLGRELDEYMIGKFVHRYHQHRVRGSSRWRHRTHYDKASSSNKVAENITLGEFCHRPCNESDKRVCQFSIEVHLYQTLSRACYNCPSNITDCERPECVTADGTRRMIVAVNKEIPGPAIQVCAGDKVLVDVFNNLPSTAVTIHWHGLTLGPTPAVPKARATPFMDGTPGVTQCPIPPGSGFRYSFDATDPGTHFWHAQTGLERGDGVFGPLIIHQTMEKDPMLILAEHMFVVNDWFHATTQLKYVMKQNSGEQAKPKSILINGQGRHKHDDNSTQVPYFNFIVEKNMRYRLRIINAASTNCPVTITLDSHDLFLLAADGSSINPVNTSTVLVQPGERYDATFTAEQESGDDGAIFWIRVDGGNDCEGLAQYASLQYLPTNISAGPLPTVPPNTNPSTTNITNPGTKVFTGSCETPGQRCVSALRASKALPESLKATQAAYTFYLAFAKRNIHNENFYSLLFYDIRDDDADKRVATPQINNLSFRGTSTPLLINQRPLKSENCSSEGVRRGQCTEDFCECLHIVQVPVGATVDFVLIDEGNGANTSQPVHLHGYKFWVLAHVEAASVPELIIPESENITLPEGISREKIRRLDDEGKLERYLRSPPMKDTIAIPAGGYTIIRIAAENKGFWVLESQVLFDSQAGMSLVLQVGSVADLPKAPKDFPTC